MPIGMAGRLMASLDDLTHQTRITLRHPAEDKERRGDVAIVEHIEDAFGISLDAALVTAPSSSVDHAGKGFYVKIVFDVDGDYAPAVHSVNSQYRAANAVPLLTRRATMSCGVSAGTVAPHVSEGTVAVSISKAECSGASAHGTSRRTSPR